MAEENKFESEIKFPDQADWGRKELNIAEVEMPGLMGIRKEYGPQQVLDQRNNLKLDECLPSLFSASYFDNSS